MEEKLRLKCYLKFASEEDPTILITYVINNVSSSDLLSFLAGEFQVKKLIPDCYFDEENEKITIRNDNDLEECIKRFSKLVSFKKDMDMTLKLYLKLPTEHITSPLLLQYKESPNSQDAKRTNSTKEDESNDNMRQSVQIDSDVKSITYDLSLSIPIDDVIIPIFATDELNK
eukprot:TRINITY_DN6480_c0_g1_i1.p1 TRINITY_DN6480_c0_g1~~TRINITY_DN6480_c0_g1_i1.p1  ORF type:complete len:172 (+),score=59.58 TRINITY_DN6480_c0_g1_i1:56-571(+)